jgi:hypothetical protein
MARVPYTDADDATILEIRRTHSGKGNWIKVAAARLKRSEGSIESRYEKLSEKAKVGENETTHAAFANTPLSLDDVIRLWDIDEDVWEAVHFQPNQWEIGAKHPESGEILTKPLYQTKVQFKRKKTASIEIVAKQILADIERAAKAKPILHGKAARDGDLMFELSLPDLHLGKQSWGEQTGADYDLKTTEKVARAAVTDLLNQIDGRRIARILMPFGNDYFHTDTLQGTTTAGTHVDQDSRFQKMFRVGHLLATWMIDECLKVAPVHVPVVPGNHDSTAAFTMGMVLEAEYRRNKFVTFDNAPTPRKYLRFGKTFLGFLHGHTEPHAKLPQIMAVERPDDWAASICREIHVGHLHHSKKAEPLVIQDLVGATVRFLRSLSAPDRWHSEHGYVGVQRSAEGFLWRKEGGLRSHLISLPVEELVA